MSQEDFRYIAENTPDILCLARLGDRVLTYVSPSCRNVLGWEPEELIGKGPSSRVFEDDLPLVEEAVRRTDRRDEHSPMTVRMRRKDGSLVWIEINPRLIVDDETGEPVEVMLVMRDATQRKLLEEKLQALAMTDGLTGLANRRAFDDALEREWKRTLREGTQISLLLVDVDRFKRFNDEYGHQVGDDCLRTVASAVRDTVRATDLVARYGGEEIAIILPAVDAAGAAHTAEKVRAAVESLQLTHAGSPEFGRVVTASVGVATALARHGGTMRMPESLVQAADNALYKAKRNGRNRVELGLLIAPQDLKVA
jgi:diguanylate cyclase (GGDEF)-like protein/PAS domain S-box-containing protein